MSFPHDINIPSWAKVLFHEHAHERALRAAKNVVKSANTVKYGRVFTALENVVTRERKTTADRKTAYDNAYTQIVHVIDCWLRQEIAVGRSVYSACVAVCLYIQSNLESDYTVTVRKNYDESNTYDGTEISENEYQREMLPTAHIKWLDANDVGHKVSKRMATYTTITGSGVTTVTVRRADVARGKVKRPVCETNVTELNRRYVSPFRQWYAGSRFTLTETREMIEAYR